MRKKFAKEIEEYASRIAMELYEDGKPPIEIIAILESKGVKDVTSNDVQYWRRKSGSAPKYRSESKPRTPRKEAVAEATIAPDGYLVLPKSNIEELKKLLNLMIAQLEGLEYERTK